MAENLHTVIFNQKLADLVLDNVERELTAEEAHSSYSEFKDLFGSLESLEDWCDSPIELMLGAALCFASDGYQRMTLSNASLGDSVARYERGENSFEGDFGTFFAPQVIIGGYRADFLIVSHIRGLSAKLIVECDGHDFHERTKEQASRDKKRDRHFALLGIPVLRFTGSDIHHRLDECIEDIEALAFLRLEALLIEKGLAPGRGKECAA